MLSGLRFEKGRKNAANKLNNCIEVKYAFPAFSEVPLNRLKQSTEQLHPKAQKYLYRIWMIVEFGCIKAKKLFELSISVLMFSSY